MNLITCARYHCRLSETACAKYQQVHPDACNLCSRFDTANERRGQHGWMSGGSSVQAVAYQRKATAASRRKRAVSDCRDN